MNLHSLPKIGHLEYTQGQKLAKWMREACPMDFFSPLRISRLKFECLLVAPMGTTPLKFIIVPWKRDRFFKRNLVFQPPFFGTTLVEKQTTLTWFFPKKQKAAAFHPGKPFDWKTNRNLEGFFFLFVSPFDVIPILWVNFYG